jgi:hypothetical protein
MGYAAKRQHPLYVVAELLEPLPDRSVAAALQQVHHDGPQEGENRGPDPVGVAMSVLTQLGIGGPVPLVLNAPSLPDQAQQGLRRGPHAGEKQLSPLAACSSCERACR